MPCSLNNFFFCLLIAPLPLCPKLLKWMQGLFDGAKPKRWPLRQLMSPLPPSAPTNTAAPALPGKAPLPSDPKAFAVHDTCPYPARFEPARSGGSRGGGAWSGCEGSAAAARQLAICQARGRNGGSGGGGGGGSARVLTAAGAAATAVVPLYKDPSTALPLLASVRRPCRKNLHVVAHCPSVFLSLPRELITSLCLALLPDWRRLLSRTPRRQRRAHAVCSGSERMGRPCSSVHVRGQHNEAPRWAGGALFFLSSGRHGPVLVAHSAHGTFGVWGCGRFSSSGRFSTPWSLSPATPTRRRQRPWRRPGRRGRCVRGAASSRELISQKSGPSV